MLHFNLVFLKGKALGTRLVALLSILENPQFRKVKVVVAIVIVINSVICGFS